MTRELYSAAKDPEQIMEVDQSRLVRLYDTASSEYDARVVAFFKEAIPTSDKLTPPARGK